MTLVYLDEAGKTGGKLDDPTQTYHYVGGLLVDESSWAALGADLGNLSPDRELHGGPLWAGTGPWRDVDVLERNRIYGAALDLVAKHRCQFVYGRCDKVKLRNYLSPMHPHEIACWLCYELVARRLNHRRELGILVADEGDAKLKKIARKVLDDYRRGGPPFGAAVDFSRIVDTVHFLDSHYSRHLQLCDLALYLLRRSERETEPSDRYHSLRNKVVAVDHATFPY